MQQHIITGFHAVEERVRRVAENASAAEKSETASLSIQYSKIGPRVKKILELAKKAGVSVAQVDSRTLDSLVSSLPETARDHRGIVLIVTGESQSAQNKIDFDQWIKSVQAESGATSGNAGTGGAASEASGANAGTSENGAGAQKRRTVLILDSITDPHNVGAILRSCDQFGASLVIMPARRGANIDESEIIARASAGSAAWVPVAVVTNLVRAAEQLKEAGFWLYGADAGGKSVQNIQFPPKTAIVMGSEGSGISRLLEKQCDSIVSIPTCGKIDSLNVSVAAGVLLYETYRQTLNCQNLSAQQAPSSRP